MRMGALSAKKKAPRGGVWPGVSVSKADRRTQPHFAGNTLVGRDLIPGSQLPIASLMFHRFVPLHLAIAQEHDTVRMHGDVVFVRHQNDRVASLVETLKKAHNF